VSRPTRSGHHGPKSGDIRKTLGKDLTQAKAEARRLVVQYETEFEAARRRLTAKPVPLTAELVPIISKSFEAHVLRADEEGRIVGLDADEFEVHAAWAAAELETLKKAHARGGTEPVSAILDDWLVGLGIAANPDSDAYKLLRRRVMEARIRSLQGVSARNEGDIVETPDALTPDSLQQTLIDESATIAPTVPKRRSAGHRLADVVKYWKGATAKSLRSEMAADGLVREFVELHGDLPLRDIEKSHFVALRDAMLKRVKPATVQARFNLLKAAYTTLCFSFQRVARFGQAGRACPRSVRPLCRRAAAAPVQAASISCLTGLILLSAGLALFCVCHKS
jgi:hypothetical protein